MTLEDGLRRTYAWIEAQLSAPKMEIYRRERDFAVCGAVGICAMTRAEFVRAVFSLPVKPVSAAVFLAGVPARILHTDIDIDEKCNLSEIVGRH